MIIKNIRSIPISYMKENFKIGNDFFNGICTTLNIIFEIKLEQENTVSLLTNLYF